MIHVVSTVVLWQASFSFRYNSREKGLYLVNYFGLTPYFGTKCSDFLLSSRNVDPGERGWATQGWTSTDAIRSGVGSGSHPSSRVTSLTQLDLCHLSKVGYTLGLPHTQTPYLRTCKYVEGEVRNDPSSNPLFRSGPPSSLKYHVKHRKEIKYGVKKKKRFKPNILTSSSLATTEKKYFIDFHVTINGRIVVDLLFEC